MSIRSKIIRNILLPIGDQFFGQQMIKRLKFLEKAQYWPQEKMVVQQTQDLKSLIRVAYEEVPFYRMLMDENKITPNDIQTRDDLRKLPVVTKEMFRKGYPNLTTRKTGQKTYEAYTSGSTGKNFIVLEDSQTAGWYRSTFLLQLEWTGWTIGDPHLQTGMNLNRSLDRRVKDWLFGCHYHSAYMLDDSHLEDILSVIDRFRIEYIWGYPGSLFHLARYAQSKGWNKPLKAIASWGSSLYPHYREVLKKTFQAEVFDQYGSAEGIQIAAQCEYGKYHLHSLDAVVEFLDDDGQAVKPGQTGEIIVTRLHPGPMPLIRYKIGDLGTPSEDLICQCGRCFPLMRSIQGRSGDIIITPSGNRLLPEYFCGILEYYPEVDNFQIVQISSNSLILKIVPYGSLSSGKTFEIIEKLKVMGASDMEIQIEIVDDIPLASTGKHRYIIAK